MRKRKYYLRLTDTEHRLIIQCLLEYRNKLLSQRRYTDGVDELIIKYKNDNRHGNSSLVPVAIYQTFIISTTDDGVTTYRVCS